MKSKNPKPALRSEEEERAFWEKEDSADHVDWSEAHRALFPNLKPSTTSISIRLSSAALMRIKQEANKRDIPYQSLIKLWLNEKLEACGRP